MINYISCGYGGRISDTLVVENCGYLDKIPPGYGIMADRGFKHIEHLVLQRGCILIRPPSVTSSVKPSKTEVMQTKRIASLRIHIEKVIRRLREFNCLQPHSCIHHEAIGTTDDIIIIASALINLQKPIINQYGNIKTRFVLAYNIIFLYFQ